MFSKLIRRNAKRSIKDYFIYVITMTIISALMFAYNSLIFSEDIQKVSSHAQVLNALILVASFFILIIVMWLIHYMVKFMMEKRSKEFGTYLLLGMTKKQISKIFIKENCLLGLFSFFLGIIPGVFIQQVINTIFFRVINQNYQISVDFSIDTLLLSIGLYFGSFLFALWRSKRRFTKMNIHDLIYLDKQNEELKEKYNSVKQYLFAGAIIYIIVFDILIFMNIYTINNIWIYLFGLVLAIYFLYVGLGAFVSRYIRRKGGSIYKGADLFLIRQLASKMSAMQFTMGTLTVLFVFALLGTTIALMFTDFQNKQTDIKFPFDIIAFSDKEADDFQEIYRIIDENTTVRDSLIYNIYYNSNQGEADQINQWAFSNLKHFVSQSEKEDSGANINNMDSTSQLDSYIQLPEATSEGIAVSEYYEYDTYMKLSDYNYLRNLLGYESVTLSGNGYLIQVKERISDTFERFPKEQELMVNGTALTFEGMYIEGLSQDGMNGSDYIIIVSDEMIQNLSPYYSVLAVDIEGDAPIGLQDKLAEEQNYGLNEEWELVTDIGFGYGTDSILVYTDTVLVKSDVIVEINFIITGLVFILVYIAVIFLCVALAILSVQQLSDSSRYKFRYQVLSELGLSKKEIDTVILKQLSWYYLCPYIASIIISIVFSLFISDAFIAETGVQTSSISYFGMSILVFSIIYLMYFSVTYVEFKRNVLK